MTIYEKIKNLIEKATSKNAKLILMLIYGIIMLVSIQFKINLITFILIFAVVPIAIYFYVIKIFPKDKTKWKYYWPYF